LLVVRQLQPWHENLAKRQVRAPKAYIRDSGLVHALLGIRTEKDLLLHPKSGASWEGYAVEAILKALQPDQAYFWATHQGAELDLLVFKGDRRIGVEIKRADAPTLTRSMRIALDDLRLDQLLVVYPRSRSYQLDDRVRVVPLEQFASADLGILLRGRASSLGDVAPFSASPRAPRSTFAICITIACLSVQRVSERQHGGRRYIGAGTKALSVVFALLLGSRAKGSRQGARSAPTAKPLLVVSREAC
jgi:hypothetical protein